MKVLDKKHLDRNLGGPLIFFFRPLAMALGYIMKRPHDPTPRGEILVIKLMGGGSLLLSMEGLLGLKKTYPNRKIKLLTTKAVKPFGEVLNIFDDIICVDDQSLRSLVTGMISVFTKCFRVDTVIDLEVYSRLTSVFSLLTLARNRIGFFRESIHFRQGMYTHLVYFNTHYLVRCERTCLSL
jgi:ADP-heptose:LPS heptosyltransferase